MEKIKLSIIIVSFNTEEVLQSCLDAIKNSTGFGPSWEIVVIDNASTDNTIKMLRDNFPGIQLISLKENVGFAAANNRGVSQTSSDYTLFLNPDAVVEKDSIKTILEYMEFHQDVGIATSKLVLPDGSLDDACHRGFPTPWNSFCYFSGLSKIFPNLKLFTGYTLGYLPKDTAHEVDSVSGAFMMVRRKAGEQIGWWDEDYFWYGDDLDFCYRAKHKSWKIMYIPQVEIFHYKGVSSGIKNHSNHLSSADLSTKIKATNARFDVMKIFYRKHYERRYSWLVKKLVLLGVELKRKIALRSLE